MHIPGGTIMEIRNGTIPLNVSKLKNLLALFLSFIYYEYKTTCKSMKAISILKYDNLLWDERDTHGFAIEHTLVGHLNNTLRDALNCLKQKEPI